MSRAVGGIVQGELTMLGFQYKGQPLNKTNAMGIQAVMTLVHDDVCMKALQPLRENFPRI